MPSAGQTLPQLTSHDTPDGTIPPYPDRTEDHPIAGFTRILVAPLLILCRLCRYRHNTGVVSSVAFSPDGHTLATGSFDHTVRLWDVSDLHYPSSLGTLTGHTRDVNSVAFSPDGQTLATGSWDNTARLWDVSDSHHPSSLGTLTGHTGGVASVTFSPDGHTLASSSNDTTARLWETNLNDVASRICRITPTLTPIEWAHYLPDFPYWVSPIQAYAGAKSGDHTHPIDLHVRKLPDLSPVGLVIATSAHSTHSLSII